MNIVQILVMLRCIFTAHSSQKEEDRKKWFNRIKKHELIRVNLQRFSSNHIIEFDAFNNHYKVQLTLNELVSPITLYQHEDGSITEIPDDDESCYYHGKVLNAASSRVALSLCEGEGIRGNIHAFGEKLFINPTDYYFAPHSDETKLSDEHLVYKSSDYNWEEQQKERSSLEAQETFPDDIVIQNNNTRRRLADGGQVELLTLIDKSWYDYHGGLSATKSFFRGAVSEASQLWTNNNLDSAVEVSIKYRYAIFDKVSSSCDRSTCLRKGRTYMSKYDGFDYGFFFTRAPEEGGKSFTGGSCYNSLKYGTALSKDDRSRAAKELAHELGHNLMKSQSGSTHDSSGTWIMDIYGEGDKWSDKSAKYLKQQKDLGKWDCFQKSGMSGKSVSAGDYENNLGGDTGGNTGGDTGGNTGGDTGGNTGGDTGGSSGGGGCIKLYNFKNTLKKLNGYWSKDGSKYKQDKSAKYLKRMNKGGKAYWMVNGKWDPFGGCAKSDILKCTGMWKTDDKTGLGAVRKGSSCKNAFSFPECFDEYENGMCLYRDSTSDAEVYERVDDEGCFNDAPVWRFLDNDGDSMYYLNKNVGGEWVINEGEMPEFGGEFICSEENLVDCTDGKWVQEADTDDEVIREVVDGVSIEECGFGVLKMNEKKGSVLTVVILIVTVLVIGLIVCGGYMFYRYHLRKHMQKNMQMVENESEDEAQDGDDINIDVTTNINTN